MVRSTLALAAVLSVASISLAGDLVTPSIGVGASTNAACKLVNISSNTITAQLQLIGAGGTYCGTAARPGVRWLATKSSTLILKPNIGVLPLREGEQVEGRARA